MGQKYETKQKHIGKRQTKERKLWRNITIASFAAVVVSLLFLGCIAFLVSILFMLVAYGQYDSRKPYKDGGHTPWYYGALQPFPTFPNTSSKRFNASSLDTAVPQPPTISPSPLRTHRTHRIYCCVFSYRFHGNTQIVRVQKIKTTD